MIRFIKNENCYPKPFLEKYNFNIYIEIYSNNSYYADSDEKYHDGKFMDLFLETIRKIRWSFFLKKW